MVGLSYAERPYTGRFDVSETAIRRVNDQAMKKSFDRLRSTCRIRLLPRDVGGLQNR
jgi:hypothetical protein